MIRFSSMTLPLNYFFFLLGLKDDATRFKEFIDQNKDYEMSRLHIGVLFKERASRRAMSAQCWVNND